MKKYVPFIVLIASYLSPFAQARLILNNGGIVNIINNAFVVIDNPNANAITRNGSGHIISEGEFNRVKWNINTASGTYSIPFGIGIGTYIPVSFTTSGASGASGNMVFATYPVGSWLNTSNLPTGIMNFINNYGGDNSKFSIDRFWRIEPVNYVTKPALNNLVLTYIDAEHAAAGNTIIESNLIAQRYNNLLDSWDDYMPGTAINTVANTATVAALPSAELYTWWTLVDNRFVLPIELSFFNAACDGNKVVIHWQTATEKNNDRFVVERSADAVNYIPIQQVNSIDPNSTRPLNYAVEDNYPLSGKAYYRLKQVDKDGKSSYSSVVVVKCGAILVDPVIAIYPNPAANDLTVDIKNLKGNRSLVIYDLLGRQMMMKPIISAEENWKEVIDISSFAKATYLLRINTDNELFQIIKFQKN